MMRTIYKYELDISKKQGILMKKNAEILSVGIDGSGNLCMWAWVDPHEEVELRGIYVYGTGWTFDDENLTFIGTAISKGGFVWHVFEDKSK